MILKNLPRTAVALFISAVLCQPVQAAVSKDEAAKLRSELTPSGATRAGNEDGSIPAWQGGLTTRAACQKKGRQYCDPFALDKAYAVVTAANAEDWRRKLSAGQKQMFRNFPDSYRLRVYPSQRSFSNPKSVYEANFENALNATLDPTGNAVSEASVGIPFPIVKDPAEPIWNHQLRYQGGGVTRRIQQATVAGNGALVLSDLIENIDYPYARGESEDSNGLTIRWLSQVTAPERSVGALALFFSMLNPIEDSRLAWNQHPVESRDRRVVPDRQFGFDTPAFHSNGLYFDDQIDGFFGSPERYAWRIVSKREMLVPYNSYKAYGRQPDLLPLLHKGHLNPELLRYELHRVWVVEARLKSRASNRHSRRVFYIDEDSWQILMVDLYDRQRRLWRSQEVHTIMAYDQSVLVPAVEVHHDLASGRYLVRALANGAGDWRITKHDDGLFTASGAGKASDQLMDELKAAREAALAEAAADEES